MHIPDSVEIIGQRYIVKRMPKKDMPNMLGFCDVNKNEIHLRETLKGDKEAEVFLHECIHIIEMQMSLGLSEKKVNSITVGVYALLHDNGYL